MKGIIPGSPSRSSAPPQGKIRRMPTWRERNISEAISGSSCQPPGLPTQREARCPFAAKRARAYTAPKPPKFAGQIIMVQDTPPREKAQPGSAWKRPPLRGGNSFWQGFMKNCRNYWRNCGRSCGIADRICYNETKIRQHRFAFRSAWAFPGNAAKKWGENHDYRGIEK